MRDGLVPGGGKRVQFYCWMQRLHSLLPTVSIGAFVFGE
jgi:hypothetical protein